MKVDHRHLKLLDQICKGFTFDSAKDFKTTVTRKECRFAKKTILKLKDEIIQRAEEVMASYSPKATMGLVNALEEDGSTPNANIRVEAAKQILDRVGLTKKEKVDINVKSVSGIFILPPKDGERAENST